MDDDFTLILEQIKKEEKENAQKKKNLKISDSHGDGYLMLLEAIKHDEKNSIDQQNQLDEKKNHEELQLELLKEKEEERNLFKKEEEERNLLKRKEEEKKVCTNNQLSKTVDDWINDLKKQNLLKDNTKISNELQSEFQQMKKKEETDQLEKEEKEHKLFEEDKARSLIEEQRLYTNAASKAKIVQLEAIENEKIFNELKEKVVTQKKPEQLDKIANDLTNALKEEEKKIIAPTKIISLYEPSQQTQSVLNQNKKFTVYIDDSISRSESRGKNYMGGFSGLLKKKIEELGKLNIIPSSAISDIPDLINQKMKEVNLYSKSRAEEKSIRLYFIYSATNRWRRNIDLFIFEKMEKEFSEIPLILITFYYGNDIDVIPTLREIPVFSFSVIQDKSKKIILQNNSENQEMMNQFIRYFN